MIIEDLYVASAASWLPTPATGAALAPMPPDCIKGSDVPSLYTEQNLSASEMTIEAVRLLGAGSLHPREAVDALIHASTYHQGQDLSPLASTILDQSFPGSGIAFEIKQMSNGGLCAMHLAACLGVAQPDSYRRIVLSAGERYCLPGIDRWRTDPGTPYGDGAAAILLTKAPGRLRILTIVLTSDSSLQGLHQSNEKHTEAPFLHGGFVQFGHAKSKFMQSNSLQSVITKVSAGQSEVMRQALAEAKLQIEDIDYFLVPHFGKRRLSSIYLPLGIPLEKTLWSWSRGVGHLGAADQFAGINQLLKNGNLKSGQNIMLLSVGAGYTWGSAILQTC